MPTSLPKSWARRLQAPAKLRAECRNRAMTSTRLTNEQTNVTSSVTGGRPPLTMQSVRDPANVSRFDDRARHERSAFRDGGQLIRRLLLARCTPCSQKSCPGDSLIWASKETGKLEKKQASGRRRPCSVVFRVLNLLPRKTNSPRSLT